MRSVSRSTSPGSSRGPRSAIRFPGTSLKNPEGVESGVKAITVDGKKLNGNLIKPHKDGQVHEVRVTMGKV